MGTVTDTNSMQMAWDEIVKCYPNQWVVIADAQMNGADIVSGRVVEVKSDDDIIPFRVANQKRDIDSIGQQRGIFMASLMQTLVFPLTNRSVRQIFDCETQTAAFRYMYDSGARVPVWCSDEIFFQKAFPSAYKKVEMVARVAGFGSGVDP